MADTEDIDEEMFISHLNEEMIDEYYNFDETKDDIVECEEEIEEEEEDEPDYIQESQEKIEFLNYYAKYYYYKERKAEIVTDLDFAKSFKYHAMIHKENMDNKIKKIDKYTLNQNEKGYYTDSEPKYYCKDVINLIKFLIKHDLKYYILEK